MLDIPKKREYILYAPITSKQRELYDAVLKSDLEGALKKMLFKELYGILVLTEGENFDEIKQKLESSKAEIDEDQPSAKMAKNPDLKESKNSPVSLKRKRSTRLAAKNYEIPDEDDLEQKVIIPQKETEENKLAKLEKHISFFI